MVHQTKMVSTYYTPKKIKNARENIQKYDWARQQRDATVQRAQAYLDYGIEALWKAVTPQSIPRGCRVQMETGSPITGKLFLKDHGYYGWKVDPLTKPWKLTDPSSGYIFPTNDFQSYYESGLDEQGIFQPERADSQFLVNELYPDRGKDWGVDNGFGWIDEEGIKWTFIAYYNHWHVWYRGIIDKGLEALRDAFLFTGEMKYAQAGIILLDRVADVYPSMDSSAYKWNDGYANSHGGTGLGKVIGSIWEPEIVWDLITAYDAFFPAMVEAGVTSFLSEKATKYKLENPKTSASLICKNIEDGIVRQIFPSINNGQIRGNFGMHQRALAIAALVLDEPGTSEQWVDWIFQTGGMEYKPELRVTGGNIMTTLVDEVDTDGFGNEASPTYNAGWLAYNQSIALVLELLERYPQANLFLHTKFKKMFDTRYPLIMIGAYTPTIGDTGKTGNPFVIGTIQEYLLAYEKYGIPVYAQYAYFLNGNKLEGLQGNLFSDDPEQITRDIEQVIREHGVMRFESTNLTGYGFAALRDGNSPDESNNLQDTQRGLWLYYGRNTGHGHKDTLNIGLHAFGLDLLPDLGYPESTGPSPKRMEWTHNTVSHNTVVVNESKQSDSWIGIPHHYAVQDRVQLIDVEAPKVYGDTDMYRRTTALIRVDEVNSYAVDLFRVKGGKDHHFSFHAASSEVSVEGLSLERQPKGTLAGPNVPYVIIDDESTTKPRNVYKGSGFHYLFNVERDSQPSQEISVDWKIPDTWGVLIEHESDIHLRLTMLGKWDEIVLADGEPPQIPGNPDKLKYVIVHNEGEQLESQFVSVIEPYKNERFIQSIEQVAMEANGVLVSEQDAAAVKVTLASGRIDYIMSSLHSDITYTIDDKFQFQGFYGVYSESNGVPEYGFLNDGALLGNKIQPLIKAETGCLQGSVLRFTTELSLQNEIIVSFSNAFDAVEKHVVGSYIYVESDELRNAAYEIKGILNQGDGTYKLDIGDITLIRKYKNPNLFSEGFVYNISEGSRFSIPLSLEWSGI